jgi:hypothetical protein
VKAPGDVSSRSLVAIDLLLLLLMTGLARTSSSSPRDSVPRCFRSTSHADDNLFQLFKQRERICIAELSDHHRTDAAACMRGFWWF